MNRKQLAIRLVISWVFFAFAGFIVLLTSNGLHDVGGIMFMGIFIAYAGALWTWRLIVVNRRK